MDSSRVRWSSDKMAPRAHWKGFIKLSLVSCSIALYPAISAAEKISFRQVNRETGHRLRQQLVDAVTGEVVASHNEGRAYEVGGGDEGRAGRYRGKGKGNLPQLR